MARVSDFYSGAYTGGEVSFALVRRLPHLAFVKIHDSEKLGDGASGQVARVITVDGCQLRALKCIEDRKSLKTVVWEETEGLDKLRGTQGLSVAFRQEVEMQRGVQHPNVLRLFAAHFTSTATYIELELANALDLYEWVAERPFTENEARAPFYQLVEGVAAMHSAGLCHRDIKLENILCEGSRASRSACRLILADFDTARHVGLSQRASTYAGTTAYMAPEVASIKVRPSLPHGPSVCLSIRSRAPCCAAPARAQQWQGGQGRRLAGALQRVRVRHLEPGRRAHAAAAAGVSLPGRCVPGGRTYPPTHTFAHAHTSMLHNRHTHTPISYTQLTPSPPPSPLQTTTCASCIMTGAPATCASCPPRRRA